MVRLKYIDTYGLLYTDWFTVGPNYIIRGVIDSINYYYEVREFNNNLIANGTAPNLRKAKSEIRRLLAESGVNFDGEIRRRE